MDFNPIALRKAKIAYNFYNFGLSECNRVKMTHRGNTILTLLRSERPKLLRVFLPF